MNTNVCRETELEIIPQIPEWMFFVSVVHFNFQVLLVSTVFTIFSSCIDILEPYYVVISQLFRSQNLDKMIVYFNQRQNLPLDARS